MSATLPAGPRRLLWPTALLLALGSFFAADLALWKSDLAVAFLDRYTPLGPTDSLMTVKARLVPSVGEQPLIVLMGSSQVREGLNCAVIEERLPGRTCRNLASIGGTPLDALYLQSRIAPRTGRRTVVLGLFPWMLHQPPKTFFTDTETVRCLLAGEAWRGMSWGQDREVLYGLLANLSESLRNREALPRIYEVVSANPLGALRFDLPPPATRLGAPLGEHLFRSEAELEETLAHGGADNPPPTFTRAQEAALDRLIARENARSSRPVLVDFPTRPGYERRIGPRLRSHYARFLEGLRSRGDIVFVGATDLPALTTDDFNDFTHLSALGRAKVSSRLAEILATLHP